MNKLQNEIYNYLKLFDSVMDKGIYKKLNQYSKEEIDQALDELIKQNKVQKFYKILCPNCDHPYFVVNNFSDLKLYDDNVECKYCGEEIEKEDLIDCEFYHTWLKVIE